MTIEIGIMLVVLVLAIVLFSLERVPPDVTALGLLLIVAITGLLTPEEAFSGFGSEVILMILGLLILTAALVRSGVIDVFGKIVLAKVGNETNKFLLLLMSVVAGLSSMMSNTGATAFFLPVILSISKQLKTSPSKYLMPLAFASILASSVTLIGTSTNLVVSGLLVSYGLEPLRMFELTVVGLPIVVVGIAYMMTLGNRLIPDRGFSETYTDTFEIQPYLTELEILPDSPLAGKSLAETALGSELDLTVVAVMRESKRFVAPNADLILQIGDLLLVEGLRDELLSVKEKTGFELKPERKISDADLESDDIGLFEVVLLPNSAMIGRTLHDLRFRERYKLQVLGINRSGEKLQQKLSKVRLGVGDELLVQGDRNHLKLLDRGNTLRLIRPVSWRKPQLKQAVIGVALFIGAISVASLNLLPLAVAVLAAAFLAFVTGIITPEEAYRSIEWRVLILIGSMLAIGKAMQVTGTAAFLADLLLSFTAQFNPIWLLVGFFILSMLLTQPMSNQAAAVVVVPIAIQMAQQLGLNPRTFAVIIAVGASTSFLTPLEPACLLIYGPGNFKFGDFPRVGLILTLLILLIAIVLVPIFWPLNSP